MMQGLGPLENESLGCIEKIDFRRRFLVEGCGHFVDELVERRLRTAFE